MKHLKNPRWIALKGVLFLVLGLLSSGLLLAEHPETRIVLLLSISIWCFCVFIISRVQYPR